MNVKFEFIYLDIIYIYIYMRVGETEKNSRKTNKIENLKENGRKRVKKGEVKERTQVEQFN